jgi:hypothetical protein
MTDPTSRQRGRPNKRQDRNFKKKKSLVKCPIFGLDTKTYWLTDRQSQCDFDFDFEPNRLMLSIGLWRWYINVIITILDIIHRPVFYLKLDSAVWVCPYLKGNTLRLSHGPNRLMLSICLWRWYTSRSNTVLLAGVIEQRRKRLAYSS